MNAKTESLTAAAELARGKRARCPIEDRQQGALA
jgi:hypothetical protein